MSLQADAAPAVLGCVETVAWRGDALDDATARDLIARAGRRVREVVLSRTSASVEHAHYGAADGALSALDNALTKLNGSWPWLSIADRTDLLAFAAASVAQWSNLVAREELAYQ